MSTLIERKGISNRILKTPKYLQFKNKRGNYNLIRLEWLEIKE